MKIDRAIEIIDTFTFASKTIPRNDVNDAIKLGIEALKKIDKIRSSHPLFSNLLLPGETEE